MLLEFVTGAKIPVGKTVRAGFDWLEANATVFFDTLSFVFETLISGVLWALQTPHPFIVIAVIAGFSYWLRRRLKTTVLVIVGFYSSSIRAIGKIPLKHWHWS